MRVLTMSRGWTTKVDMMPALRPAADSTAAGERPAWLELDMYVCPIRLSWARRGTRVRWKVLPHHEYGYEQKNAVLWGKTAVVDERMSFGCCNKFWARAARQCRWAAAQSGASMLPPILWW